MQYSDRLHETHPYRKPSQGRRHHNPRLTQKTPRRTEREADSNLWCSSHNIWPRVRPKQAQIQTTIPKARSRWTRLPLPAKSRAIKRLTILLLLTLNFIPNLLLYFCSQFSDEAIKRLRKNLNNWLFGLIYWVPNPIFLSFCESNEYSQSSRYVRATEYLI